MHGPGSGNSTVSNVVVGAVEPNPDGVLSSQSGVGVWGLSFSGAMPRWWRRRAMRSVHCRRRWRPAKKNAGAYTWRGRRCVLPRLLPAWPPTLGRLGGWTPPHPARACAQKSRYRRCRTELRLSPERSVCSQQGSLPRHLGAYRSPPRHGQAQCGGKGAGIWHGSRVGLRGGRGLRCGRRPKPGGPLGRAARGGTAGRRGPAGGPVSTLRIGLGVRCQSSRGHGSFRDPVGGQRQLHAAAAAAATARAVGWSRQRLQGERRPVSRQPRSRPEAVKGLASRGSAQLRTRHWNLKR